MLFKVTSYSFLKCIWYTVVVTSNTTVFSSYLRVSGRSRLQSFVCCLFMAENPRSHSAELTGRIESIVFKRVIFVGVAVGGHFSL